MCATIGFAYREGMVFGRTLELGVSLDNKILMVPKNTQDFTRAKDMNFSTKYSVIGSGFFDIASFGDGINEKGLMGSTNFFPGYASFAKESMEGKINMTTSNAFDYLLSRCANVDQVREEAKKILLVEKVGEETSISNHLFFMDATGKKVVLEPKDGNLLAYDNPYGVLTNAPEFPWHRTNLKNYIHLKPENVEETNFNEAMVSKLGQGTGMVGLPGDFTPASRFVRAAYFVSATDKNLERHDAILQGFRILSQFDIPKGCIIDPIENHADETLNTSVMDSQEKTYVIKCHDNINLQRFSLEDFENQKDILFIELDKNMHL